VTMSLLTLRLVELACLAPSVANSQPWRWQAHQDRLRLYVDRGRLSSTTNPSARDLVISCGAALDHLRVAARALGMDTAITRLPDAHESDLLADIRLSPGEPSPAAAEDIAILRARCTDRRRFTSWPVPDASLELLAAEARSRGAEAVSVTDPCTRFRLEMVSQSAHLESTAGPGSATETRALVESGDGVLALGGRIDGPAEWLVTGEGLSALWLRATRDGLAVVPMSLPVEGDIAREQVPGLQPHVLVRVGWQAIGRSALPRTPRRPVSEVLSEVVAVGS
jgi:hypothetical protein